MRSYPALRLGGQVFFASALLSFFRPFASDLRLFWLLSVLILLTALAAVRLSRPLPRLLLGLIPAAALLLPVSGWLSLAAGAAMVLYTVLVLALGRFSPEPWAYRLEGAWTLAITGVLAVISFFATSGGISTFYLLICAAVLVLLALRALQVSGSMRPVWQARSIGVLFACLGTGLVIGLIVWALRSVLIYVLRLILTGFALLVTLVIGLVGRLWYRFQLMRGAEDPGEDPGLPPLSFNIGGNPNPSSQVTTPGTGLTLSVEIPWLAILAAVCVLLLLFAAVRFLLHKSRSARTRRLQEANGIEVPEERRGKRKNRQVPQSNRDKLRYIYSQYLAYLRGRGLVRNGSDTTADVTEAARSLLLETDELLRELYRKARYSSEEISDEELQMAGERLNLLISADNLRK
jgi:hypothetical protein